MAGTLVSSTSRLYIVHARSRCDPELIIKLSTAGISIRALQIDHLLSLRRHDGASIWSDSNGARIYVLQALVQRSISTLQNQWIGTVWSESRGI